MIPAHFDTPWKIEVRMAEMRSILEEHNGPAPDCPCDCVRCDTARAEIRACMEKIVEFEGVDFGQLPVRLENTVTENGL